MAVDLNIQPYRFANPLKRTQETYDALSGFEQDAAAHRAGNALKAGNVRGAADALYGAGMIKDAGDVEKNALDAADAEAKRQQEREQTAAKGLAEAAAQLRQIHDKDPKATPEARKAKVLQGFDYLTPRLRALGERPDHIAEARRQIEMDPDNALTLLGSKAAEAAGYEIVKGGDGSYVAVDKKTNRPVYHFRPPRTEKVGEALVPIAGYEGEGPEPPPTVARAAGDSTVSAPGGRGPAVPGPPATPENVEAVWEANKRQESGGRGDAVGPETQYGRAYGSTQMLPATAEAMARKVGVRWDPRLMRENTPQALAYQDKLGRAYFDEGLEKYNGDVRKALAYYHGGPDERIWGPKTEAHVEAVLKKLQPTQVATLTGGTGSDVLYQAPPKDKEAPSGYRWNGANLEAIKGGPADPATRALGTGSRREFASLRKEFTSLDEVKNWKSTAAAYNQIRSLASKPNPTPADDMALTYAFMRANDPNSVVRESEFAMVAKTAGLPDRVVIALEKLTKGQGLTPGIRRDLVQAAATMTLQRRQAYDAQARNYRGIAADLGADPDQLAEDPAKWRERIKANPTATAKPSASPAPASSGGWGKAVVVSR